VTTQNQLSLSKCKRCNKPIATMKKPAHVSDETFEKFSGICAECFSPKEQLELSIAMKNDMFKNLSKPRIIT